MSNIDDKNQNSAGSDAAPRRREISGPGAADFLTSPGGLDLPETDPSKGTNIIRGEGLTESSRLTPHLDEPSPGAEREITSPKKRGE